MPHTNRRPDKIRDRAWRRAQRRRVIEGRTKRYSGWLALDARSKGQLAKTCPERLDVSAGEKRWGDLYTRRVKLARARQLGYLWPYPKKTIKEILEDQD